MNPSGNPAFRRWLITLAVMSATLIQVLDTTIVNIALPHMQGQLNANSDQISWVLTTYLISTGICMPLTGYFADILGHKRFLLACITGFVAASALCGLAQNLFEIVSFRFLQGAFGAAFIPLSQTIMSEAYPVEERGWAMAIWGMGVMVGPVLGPTFGGWLTDVASWRWVFYINLPVGLLSFILALQFIPETQRRERGMDWTGLVFLGSGIAGLQYVLDRGNQQDWFSADDIRLAMVMGVLGLVVFIVHSLRRGRYAVFDVHIFRDWNFLTSCLIIVALGMGTYGALIMQPILLERLLGYPILTAGLVMAPRGLATAISMLIVGRLVGRIDARILVTAGILLGAGGSYAMTKYSFEIDKFRLIWPIFLQGMGLGLIFVPLSTIAYATLERSRMAEAAGLYNLLRTFGSAIGISIATSVYSHQQQVSWNELGGHITALNPAVVRFLDPLYLSLDDPRTATLLAHQVAQQAQMIAMIDVFKLTAMVFILMLPMVLLLTNAKDSPT